MKRKNEFAPFFIIAVFVAAAMLFLTILCIVFDDDLFGIIFAVLTMAGSVVAGAIGLIFVVEQETIRQEEQAQKLREESRQFCEERERRKVENPFEEFEEWK
ncbi:MAG: hypothetical protein IJ308_04315 [Clostridia bacterium]|nr:hypothetical protein [Clostridia bacterium]